MSEHTPLTEDEREELRRVLDTREGSPRHRRMIAFVESILAARLAEMRGEMERVLPWTEFTEAEQQRWTATLDRLAARTSTATADTDELARAISTLLPGLRVANYVERWSPASPAVTALGILARYVGQEVDEAGALQDPHAPSAHRCRPEGEAATADTAEATMSSAECRCPDDCDCDGRFACEATTPPPTTHVCELPVGHDGAHHSAAHNWDRDYRATADTGLRERVEALADDPATLRRVADALYPNETEIAYSSNDIRLRTARTAICAALDTSAVPELCPCRGSAELNCSDATPASTEDRADNEGTR